MPSTNSIRRCVTHGQGACQYRKAPPGRKPCPGQTLLKQRLACLKGALRTALVEAGTGVWKEAAAEEVREAQVVVVMEQVEAL